MPGGGDVEASIWLVHKSARLFQCKLKTSRLFLTKLDCYLKVSIDVNWRLKSRVFLFPQQTKHLQLTAAPLVAWNSAKSLLLEQGHIALNSGKLSQVCSKARILSLPITSRTIPLFRSFRWTIQRMFYNAVTHIKVAWPTRQIRIVWQPR